MRSLLPLLVAVLLLVPAPQAAADGGPRHSVECRVPPVLAFAAWFSVLQELEPGEPWNFRRIVRAFFRRWRQLRRHWRVENCVHLNEIQVLGTHNSYHIQPYPKLLNGLASFDQGLADSLEYTHRPLDEQLEELGIRQFELDVFADPDVFDRPVDGHYQFPLGPILVADPPLFIPELVDPGFKVFHVQDVDFDSTCFRLVDCLEIVRDWSDDNPRHLPIAIMIELKDSELEVPFNLGWDVPPVIDGPLLDDLDDEIRSVFPPDQLITPDDVRGEHATLEDAVLQDGWPSLRESRGRVIFLMDNGGTKHELYREGRPSLEGRVLFTNATPGDADAAFVKRNDPFGGGDPSVIPDLVSDGYIVRTRADSPTEQARSGDTTQRDAALESGAQYVSTDYPEESPFGSGYIVELPRRRPARCNPINAPRF